MKETLRCLVDDDGCRGQVPRDAPLPLCTGHFAAAAEWSVGEHGVADVLPGPCLLCGSRWGVRFPSGWTCGVCEWRVGDVVDDELPPPRVEVVYYLRYAERVKIGTTARPRARLAAIRHDELLGFERGGRTLEQRRHAQFAAARFARTEWFSLTDELRAHIAAVAAGAVDPWDRHARWVSEAIALRG
ncbi:hypothetical protein P0L94_05925 [Microbacter sp. GSS18]|nr:hypothetical protein P0L94_05925 [Microbacter sp. GSS18]